MLFFSRHFPHCHWLALPTVAEQQFHNADFINVTSPGIWFPSFTFFIIETKNSYWKTVIHDFRGQHSVPQPNEAEIQVCLSQVRLVS